MLTVVDWVCFVAFATECFLKIVAFGFILTPTAYLLSRWNWLDGTVVVVSVIDIVNELLGLQSPIASACRLLRILRPLKLLRMIDGMPIQLSKTVLVIY